MSSERLSTFERAKHNVSDVFDGGNGSKEFWNRVFIGAPLLYLGIFLLFGFLYMVVISFWQVDQYVLIADWTLQNYVNIFVNGPYLYFIAKSFLLATAVTATCLIVGYPIAYYVSKELKTHQQLTVLMGLSAPFFVGTLVRIFAHQGLIGPAGLLNMIAAKLGFGMIGLFAYSNFQTFIGEVYLWIPFMILSLFLSLDNIDFNLLEAGYDSGAPPIRAFYEVVWPLSRPGVVIGSVLVFIPTFTDSIVPTFVGGPDGAQIGMIVHSLFGSSGEWAFGAALSVVLIVISLAVIGVLGWTIPWEAFSIGGDAE